ncbi:hypothetical protein DZA65_01329 [Dickeya dianthicola]|uniref:Uncharacterized protein n=1 Tax=Dickeya dianthicola TaxID=204039 RepID=A0AAX1C1P2_9GAMM|nr:hypothetical protein DZA65_01329 [Dickeya dianthicola]PWD70048.1 hypothetical protein DF213_18860 [Dickeya dianthicola]RJL66460.1 hypothetical protein D5072_14730 [Dickeya dianthicola]RJL76393.1 hypothetical protein D5077_00795 [Dickeya dianthicola]
MPILISEYVICNSVIFLWFTFQMRRGDAVAHIEACAKAIVVFFRLLTAGYLVACLYSELKTFLRGARS